MNKSRSTWPWVVAILVAFVAYPLSLGPMIWLDRHKMLPKPAPRVLEIFYTPLRWVKKSSPTAGKVLDGYVDFWKSV